MSGMKQIGIVVGIGMLVTGLAFGDTAADIKAAMQVYNAGKGDVVKAQAMFEAIPDNAQAKEYAAHCMRVQGKVVEAIPVFEAALAMRTNTNNRAYLQITIAACQFQLDKKADAEALLKKVLTDYPEALPSLKSMALNSLGTVLSRQGKHAEANDVWVKYVVLAVRAKPVDTSVTKAFNAIRPDLMTTDAYKAALQDILKATPAIETNTTFLGQVKSELEKIK